MWWHNGSEMLLSRHCYASMRIHTHAHDATTKSPLRPSNTSLVPSPSRLLRSLLQGLLGASQGFVTTYNRTLAGSPTASTLALSGTPLDPFPFTPKPTMAEILSLNTYYLSFPTDAYNSDVVAVQLKSYKQKDAYLTVAVFKDYVTAREFVLEFPTIPGSRLRIIDCFHNVLLVTDPISPVESQHRKGTTDWWLDQSREIKECVGISEPLLPKFSIRNMAKRILNSFVAA